jgi:hypothetical protein
MVPVLLLQTAAGRLLLMLQWLILCAGHLLINFTHLWTILTQSRPAACMVHCADEMCSDDAV